MIFKWMNKYIFQRKGEAMEEESGPAKKGKMDRLVDIDPVLEQAVQFRCQVWSFILCVNNIHVVYLFRYYVELINIKVELLEGD